MQSTSDGPYIIEHGDVWYVTKGATPGGAAMGLDRRHVGAGTEMIAVAFDSENGVLHKHGASKLVESWSGQTRKKFNEGGFPEMADAIVVISFLPTPQTIAELNACVTTTGRVLGLEHALLRMIEESPDLAKLPVYPAP